MKFRWDKKYLYWGITAILVIAFGITLFFLMFRGTNFTEGISSIISEIMPIINGFIIAYLLSPIVNSIEFFSLKKILKKDRTSLSEKQQKYLRMIAITLTLLLSGMAVYVFFLIVIPQLLKSIQSIIQQFPSYVRNLIDWLEWILQNNPQLETMMHNVIEEYSPAFKEWFNGTFVPQINDAIMAISGYAINLIKAVWDLIIGLIVSVYLLSGKERFAAQSKKIVYSIADVKKGNQFIDDCRFIHSTFGGFISGKLLDSLIIGIICFFVTSIIGTPYHVLISVIIGVTNIIPFFGPFLGAIPSALLILMIDPLQCLYFLIFVLVLQQFDGNFLGPKILGDSTGLSSFWVIFAITFFGGIMGVPGMVIGVPTFAVIYALIRRRVNRGLKKKNLPTDTEEYKDLIKITEDELKMISDTSEPVEKDRKKQLSEKDIEPETAHQDSEKQE